MVILSGKLVDEERDAQFYSFPLSTRQKALNIVRRSLYPLHIVNLSIEKNKAVATLEVPLSFFYEVGDSPEWDSPEWDLLNYLVDNYGNGAPDGWMESDIFISDDHELWLNLISVAFYKNNYLYLLFENLPNDGLH